MEIVLRNEFRDLAFDKQSWLEYFDVDIGEEPPIPNKVFNILDGSCPFLLEGETSR